MNVEFIPVFYAAFAGATAIAELRPGIGDSIAIGRFTTRVPLKVFDFTVFDRRAADRTHFYDHSRYDFINQMSGHFIGPIAFLASVFGLTGQSKRNLINV